MRDLLPTPILHFIRVISIAASALYGAAVLFGAYVLATDPIRRAAFFAQPRLIVWLGLFTLAAVGFFWMAWTATPRDRPRRQP